MKSRKLLSLVIMTAMVLTNLNLFFVTSYATDPNQGSDVYFYDDFFTGYEDGQTTFNSELSFNGVSGTQKVERKVLEDGTGILAMTDNRTVNGVEFYKDLGEISGKPKLVLQLRLKPLLNFNGAYFSAASNATASFAVQRGGTGGNGFKKALNETALQSIVTPTVFSMWHTITIVYDNETDSRDIYIDDGTTVKKYAGQTGATYASTGKFVMGFKTIFDYDIATYGGTMDVDYIKLSKYYEDLGFQIVNAESTELNYIDVQFDFPVKASSIVPSKFSVAGATVESVTAHTHIPNRYRIAFAEPLAVGENSALSVDQVQDISERTATDTKTFTTKDALSPEEEAILAFTLIEDSSQVDSFLETHGATIWTDLASYQSLSTQEKDHFAQSILAQKSDSKVNTMEKIVEVLNRGLWFCQIAAENDVASLITSKGANLGLSQTLLDFYEDFSLQGQEEAAAFLSGNKYLLPQDVLADFSEGILLTGAKYAIDATALKDIVSTLASEIQLSLTEYNALSGNSAVEQSIFGNSYPSIQDFKVAWNHEVGKLKSATIVEPASQEVYYYDNYETGAGSLPEDLISTKGNAKVVGYEEGGVLQLTPDLNEASPYTLNVYKDLGVIPGKPKLLYQARLRVNMNGATDKLSHYTTDSPTFAIMKNVQGSDQWAQRDAANVKLEDFDPADTGWHDVTVVYSNTADRLRTVYINDNKYTSILGGQYNATGKYTIGFLGTLIEDDGYFEFDYLKLSNYVSQFDYEVVNAQNAPLNQLLVKFNFPVKKETIRPENFYVPGANITAVSKTADANTYALTFAEPLLAAEDYTLATVNVASLDGALTQGARAFTTKVGPSVSVRILTNGVENATGGTVTPGGSVAQGEPFSVTASPNEGYEIEYIKYNQAPVVAYEADETTYTTTPLMEDAAITVSFRSKTQELSVPKLPVVFNEIGLSHPSLIAFATARQNLGEASVVQYGMVFSKTNSIPRLNQPQCVDVIGTEARNILGQFGIRFTGPGLIPGETYYAAPYAIYNINGETQEVYGETILIKP